MPECIPEDALPANHRVHRNGPAAAAEWLSWRCWSRGRVPEDDPPSGSATADTGSHPSRAQGEGNHVLTCSACARACACACASFICSSTASASMQCPQFDSRVKLCCPGGGVAQPPVCGALMNLVSVLAGWNHLLGDSSAASLDACYCRLTADSQQLVRRGCEGCT